MKLFSIFSLALVQAVLVLSASLRIDISPSTLLPNPNTLPASTHAVLISGTSPPQRAVLRKGNYLLFPTITTSGSHLLTIFTRDYTFAQYRIDISPSTASEASLQITGAYETYPGTQWSDHGIPLTPAGQPTLDLTLNAKILSQKNFYQQREGFNVMNLAKNPMLLMGVVGVAFMWGMPKMLENMDPEMREEYEQMQKKSGSGMLGKMAQAQSGGGGGSGVEGFDMAGWLAGKSTGTSTGGGGGGSDIRERKR